ALADYGASQSALQLEIARQYPDVRIGPGYEYDQGLNKWSTIGVSLELPVLNRNAGPIGEADARRTEAAARFAELQATVIDEIDRALANRDASREALARSEAGRGARGGSGSTRRCERSEPGRRTALRCARPRSSTSARSGSTSTHRCACSRLSATSKQRFSRRWCWYRGSSRARGRPDGGCP